MKLTEQETTVTFAAADDTAEVWTCIPKHVNAFRRRGATELESGTYDDGTEWARFQIAAGEFKPALAYRPKRDLTDEQRERYRLAGERLQAARDAA